MCLIGVDAHRQTITAVAVSVDGQRTGSWTGTNRIDDWAQVLAWAERRRGETERLWGIEGSGNQGRGLAQFLLGQGEAVVEINPRWTAAARNRRRRIDKSDTADAQAITRVLREEGDQLPRLQADDDTTPLAILTRERDSLLTDLTRERNRLHVALLQVDPAYKIRIGRLDRRAGIDAVLVWDAHRLRIAQQVHLHSAQRRARRILALLDDLDAISAELQERAEPVAAPLQSIFGVAALTAAMLAGYLGPGPRFASDAQLASYAGVAPLETSSAGVLRHRLNRTGHRRLNAVIHRIALTQARGYGPAQDYIARRRAGGNSWREAIRALKRQIIRRIWSVWKQCLANLGDNPSPSHS
jgi:transposase